MNTNKKRIIAVICLLVFVVGVFVACKKKDTDEKLVSVSTDENGSLYYTDPTYEVDGIDYGGETHFVKPDETNKNGEYKIGDITSQSYTTDDSGNVAPVTRESVTTTADSGNTTSSGGNSSSGTATTKPDTGTTSGGSSGTDTSSSETQSQTSEVETSELHGISNVVDSNKLSNDGVINAW